MKVIDLIQHLQTLPQDLPVYVRMEDPLCEADYWQLTAADIIVGEVIDSGTKADYNIDKEIQAVLIGDERV